MNLFTPKGFLTIGGGVLLLVGILGYVGVIGPTAAQSPFGEAWYFDDAENLAHTVLGVVAIAAAYVLSAGMRKNLVLLLGVVGILVAGYNLFSTSLLGATLQNPADLILHLVIGAWALYASMGSGGK
ncbi:MAG: hypothetical protein WEA61_10990 [Anaerolineales bacterium]